MVQNVFKLTQRYNQTKKSEFSEWVSFVLRDTSVNAAISNVIVIRKIFNHK